MNLSTIDLNLLGALEALLDERSLTKAAARRGIGLPAMKHVLETLRDLFGDALLVRTPKGMARTPRAEVIAGELRALLDAIRALVQSPAPFEPASCRDTFNLATADYAEFVFAPRLAARLAVTAPGVEVSSRRLTQSHPVRDLDSGRVDIAIGPFDQEAPQRFRRFLFRDRMVCVVRAKHPALEGDFNLERFASFSHVTITSRGIGGSHIDRALAERGLSRRVLMRVPHFSVAPAIVASSDLIATLPERVALAAVDTLGLRILALPLPLPGVVMSAMWHERTHTSPSHSWLRSLLSDICSDVCPDD